MNLRPIKTVNPGIVRRTLMKMPVIKKIFISKPGNLTSGLRTSPLIATHSVDAIHHIDLAGSLKKTVMSLDYPEDVAKAFTDEAMGWKDASGIPMMHSWKATLDKAREEHKSGKLGLNELVNIESNIINELGNKIKSEFSYDPQTFGLEQALQGRHAQCETYTEMIHATASALGFPVQGAEVPKMAIISWDQNQSHAVCLIGTADKQTILVDIAMKPIIISMPFMLLTRFEKNGNDLVLKPGRIKNDISDYLRIKLLDANSLAASRYCNRAITNRRLGQHKQSIADFNQAINIGPEYAPAFFGLGNTYSRMNEAKQAIAYYDKAIMLDPEYYDAYNNRGTLIQDLGNYQQAIADFNKAISINPEDVAAYNNRGTAYNELGQYKQAINDLNIAISLDPSDSDAHDNRGIAFINLGMSERGLADFNKSISLNSNNAQACRNRGYFYFNSGKYQLAIDDYTSAININPNDAKALYMRGICFLNHDQINQGLEDLQSAGKLNPSFLPAIDKLINGLRSKGYIRGIDANDKDKSAQSRNPLNSSALGFIRFSQNSDKYYISGYDNYKNGHFEQAAADFTLFIGDQPKFAIAYCIRGLAYFNLGRYGKAISDYDKAITIDPKFADAYYNRGIALINSGITHKNQGQINKGVADLRKAGELNSAHKPDIETAISELKSKGLLNPKA